VAIGRWSVVEGRLRGWRLEKSFLVLGSVTTYKMKTFHYSILSWINFHRLYIIERVNAAADRHCLALSPLASYQFGCLHEFSGRMSTTGSSHLSGRTLGRKCSSLNLALHLPFEEESLHAKWYLFVDSKFGPLKDCSK